MDLPQMIKISRIEDETPLVKTFYFDVALKSKPGQFVMLWVPGYDQKPFSVGYDDGQQFGLTIFKRGPTTEQLFSMKAEDQVGLTGPFGTAFSVQKDINYIMVAGGYGAAPLGFLAEEAVKLHCSVDFCMGARSKEHLLFEQRLEKLDGLRLHITTDDGSRGQQGFVTDLLLPLLQNKKDTTLVTTCGPELMEKKVLDLCNQHEVNCEISIERYMKCGFGVCGQCCVDPLGIRMCTEGPVVKRELANQITEFGKYYRDKTGTKHML